MIRYNSDSTGAVEAYSTAHGKPVLRQQRRRRSRHRSQRHQPAAVGPARTGLFSATSNTVSIAENSTDIMDITSTGASVTGSVTASTSVIAPTHTATGALAIKPGSDSTTAVQIQTNGGSSILDVDTTNSRVGIGTATPATLLHVNGAETLGVNGATTGTLLLATSVGSGASITLQNGGATTGYTFDLPTTVGAVGALLTSQNGSAMQWIPDVATGEVLTSGGTSTNPAYSATPTLGIAASTTGSLTLANGAASGKTVTIAPSSSMTAANWTLTLPTSAGSNTYVLSTDGSGNTSWVSQGSGATITLGVSATPPTRRGQARRARACSAPPRTRSA